METKKEKQPKNKKVIIKKEYQEHKDLYGQSKFYTEIFVRKIAEDLVHDYHAGNGNVGIYIWLANKGIQYMTFERWMKRYPFLKEAYGISKQLRSDKLIENALRRKTEWSIVKYLINHLTDDYLVTNSKLSASMCVNKDGAPLTLEQIKQQADAIQKRIAESIKAIDDYGIKD